MGPLASASPASYWTQFHLPDFLAHIVTLRLIASPPVVTPFVTSNINGALWTIHEEFLCYLAVALLGSLGLYNRRAALLTLCVALFGVSLLCLRYFFFFASHLRPAPELMRFPPLLTAFLCGACFFLFQDKIVFTKRGVVLCFAAMAALLRWGVWPFLWLPFEAYLLFAFAFTPRIRLHHFARYGDFSYGMYLYAYPIQCLLVQHFIPGISAGALFLLTTPLALLCAILSWRFVEQPSLRLAKRPAVRSLPSDEANVESRLAPATN